MYASKKNIDRQIVEGNANKILRELAPEFHIDPSKVSEIAGSIVNGLVLYKSIDKLAVTEVVKAVVPGTLQLLSNLADKFYDCLLSCQEEKRAEEFITTIVCGVVCGGVVLLGGHMFSCIACVAIAAINQNGKTQRTNIRWRGRK